MKKAIALLLALMVVMSLTLVAVACDEEEATEEEVTTESVEVTESTEAASEAVDWTDAANYEESTATITGEIAAVKNLFEIKGIPKVLFVMGDPEGDHFNVAINLNADGTYPTAAAAYEGMVDMLVGQTVEATGTVVINAFESCYEIILNSEDDVETFVGTMELAS